MICRGVVTYLNERTLWGRLVYALDNDGDGVVDALSAALLVNAAKVARSIRLDGVAKTLTVKELEFHTTSFHGGYGRDLQPGQLVEVHLNIDNRLVAVWYEQKRSASGR